MIEKLAPSYLESKFTKGELFRYVIFLPQGSECILYTEFTIVSGKRFISPRDELLQFQIVPFCSESKSVQDVLFRIFN